MSTQVLEEHVRQTERRIKIYKRLINEAERSFRQLNAQNMQGTLIQFEDFLDSSHLYAFRNWIEGVVWDGPNVKRYWVSLILKYPYEKMPEPTGGMRLVNMGAYISYKQSTEKVPKTVKGPEDLDPITRKPKEEEVDIWLIEICVPRRFIQDAIEDQEEMEPEPQVEEPKEEPAEGEEGLGVGLGSSAKESGGEGGGGPFDL